MASASCAGVLCAGSQAVWNFGETHEGVPAEITLVGAVYERLDLLGVPGRPGVELAHEGQG